MKILVAYDDSKVSKSVLGLARKHANSFKAEIFFMTSMKQGPELKKEDIEKIESELEKIKKSFKSEGYLCESQASVCIKSPGEELVEFAKNNNVDEIIIGIKKKSKVGKLMFGSNAQYVILNAHCPVVTVK